MRCAHREEQNPHVRRMAMVRCGAALRRATVAFWCTEPCTIARDFLSLDRQLPLIIISCVAAKRCAELHVELANDAHARPLGAAHCAPRRRGPAPPETTARRFYLLRSGLALHDSYVSAA